MPAKVQKGRGKSFFDWCMENGERGKQLLREFYEVDKLQELTKGSSYKAKWKCQKCKHLWRATVMNRTRSGRASGCPKCCLSRGQGCHTVLSRTNNFLTWCEKNGERGKKLREEYCDTDKHPTSVTKGSHYKALWRCGTSAHEWRAKVNSRTNGVTPSGCPQCKTNPPVSNFLTWCEKNGERGKKLHKEYVDEDKKPSEVSYGSNYKALWKCETCANEWRALVKSRTKSDGPHGCPECNIRGRQPAKRKRADDDA